MKPGGQPDRLLTYLRTHQGASSFEINRDLEITNATGRVSDLRARSKRPDSTFRLVKALRSDGRDGYWIEYVGDGTLGLIAS